VRFDGVGIFLDGIAQVLLGASEIAALEFEVGLLDLVPGFLLVGDREASRWRRVLRVTRR
jgi:hypothetical protein